MKEHEGSMFLRECMERAVRRGSQLVEVAEDGKLERRRWEVGLFPSFMEEEEDGGEEKSKEQGRDKEHFAIFLL